MSKSGINQTPAEPAMKSDAILAKLDDFANTYYAKGIDLVICISRVRCVFGI